MIQGQLWVEVSPETSDMAFILLDAMAKTEAERMNCDLGDRRVSPEENTTIVWWPIKVRS